MKLLPPLMCGPLALASCGAAQEDSVADKPYAIVAAWISSPSPTGNITTQENDRLLAAQYCMPLLALRQAVDVMTLIARHKFPEDKRPWVRVLLVNSSTVPPGGLRFLRDRGVHWRDIGQDPFLVRFREAGGYPAGAKEVITVAKLIPLWFTEFSYVLVVDTDNIGQPNVVQPLIQGRRSFHTNGSVPPLLRTLGAGDDIAFRSGRFSPINAGLFAARPSMHFRMLLMSAIDHGFTIADGWGGNYNISLLSELTEKSVPLFVKQLAANRCQPKSTLRPCCLANPPMWCFVGREQDQGLLVYLLLMGHYPNSSAQSKEIRKDMFSVFAKPGSDVPLFRMAFKHFAYTPKPFQMEKWHQELQPYLVNPNATDGRPKRNMMENWWITNWFWTKFRNLFHDTSLSRNDTVCPSHFDQQASIFKSLSAKVLDAGLCPNC